MLKGSGVSPRVPGFQGGSLCPSPRLSASSQCRLSDLWIFPVSRLKATVVGSIRFLNLQRLHVLIFLLPFLAFDLAAGCGNLGLRTYLERHRPWFCPSRHHPPWSTVFKSCWVFRALDLDPLSQRQFRWFLFCCHMATPDLVTQQWEEVGIAPGHRFVCALRPPSPLSFQIFSQAGDLKQ